MTLIDEYLECVNRYTEIDEEFGNKIFDYLSQGVMFHAGGRISKDENPKCIYIASIEFLKIYLESLGISKDEDVILYPFNYEVPIIKTKLGNFYDCFDDCLAACSDVWLLFEDKKLLVECNHDDEIIVCNNIE